MQSIPAALEGNNGNISAFVRKYEKLVTTNMHLISPAHSRKESACMCLCLFASASRVSVSVDALICMRVCATNEDPSISSDPALPVINNIIICHHQHADTPNAAEAHSSRQSIPTIPCSFASPPLPFRTRYKPIQLPHLLSGL